MPTACLRPGTYPNPLKRMKKIGRLFGLAAVAAAFLVGGTAGMAQAVPLLIDQVTKIKFTNYG